MPHSKENASFLDNSDIEASRSEWSQQEFQGIYSRLSTGE